MNQGYPRLLGDIGGTNARWAWQASAGAELQDVSVQPCEDSASIQESAANYLLAHGHANPRWAGIGIATVITGDDVRLTNSSWRFSIAAFKQTMGLERCLVVNDFTALAMSLPALKSTDLQALGGGVAVAGATIGLLGPGTGLGVSLAGEGGHVTLSANDDVESNLLALLRKQFDHVSAERVLSGSGLVNIYKAVCAMQR